MGQYKVASGDLVHTGPGTAARRDIDRADTTTLGTMPPAAALVGLPCTATSPPGWLDQQRRRYPKHTGARGHVIFWWPASTTKIPVAGAYVGDGMPPPKYLLNWWPGFEDGIL